MPGRVIAALLLYAFIVSAHATEPATPKLTPEQFEASLKYQHGTISLPGGRATLQVPESFRYLAPDDAQRVLVDAWGNPPDKDVLGMLFPTAAGPLDKDGWGIVITYADDGHVSDTDADAINFTELLKQMQDASVQANAERKKQGYEEVHLLGWAEPPHYDKQSKKLYWAQEARFGDSTHNTLNYNIRILGRKGVLVLNAVAGMDQLATVKAGMPTVVGFTNFADGNRYADFNEGAHGAILREAQRAKCDDPRVAGGPNVLSESAR